MSQPNPKRKILVNGCSHTRAEIPDGEEKLPWPKILADKLECQLVNLAKDGKANYQIVEETIRYLLNDSQFEHVVVQLTEWKRLNFFRSNHSFTWIPADIESQTKDFGHVKIPAVNDKDLRVTRFLNTPNEKHYDIGDKSLVNNIITTGTLVSCLYSLCERLGISLTIINYHSIGDCVYDAVWKSIPNECFLIKNKTRGMYNHLLWNFETPDTFHFEQASHYYLANLVYEHYVSGKRITVNDKDYDMTFNNAVQRIFSYE